jgi:DNA polymerase-4
MDAFYASVEQRDRPELRGRPVIVGGTSDRGVVTAASYEARPFGVHSAMPTVEARKLCPEAVFLRGDMAKYRRIGAQIRTVFATISSAVEPVSLDEAFMDITGSIALLGAPLTIGRVLKERVATETGLAVSVGMGPGKMVAKIASDESKPDGLLEVPPERVVGFLHPLPVRRLWGVGPVTAAALARMGITTIGDLAGCDGVSLAAHVGHAAEHLVQLARGVDARLVESDREARSYGEEGTFAHDVSAPAIVRDAIIAHAEAVARRLRHDGVRARTVVLKMKLARPLGGGKFPVLSRRTTLPEPTDDGHVLSGAALQLWERIDPRPTLRLVGVSASGITAGDGAQLTLFHDGVLSRRRALNEALDRIVTRFGPESIVRGGGPREKGLTMRVKSGE